VTKTVALIYDIGGDQIFCSDMETATPQTTILFPLYYDGNSLS